MSELSEAVAVAGACGESAAGLGWYSASVPAHRDQLVAEVYARIHEDDYRPVDIVLGFGKGEVDTFGELAANVRFNPEGYVDARNGDTYESATQFRYHYDHLYAVRFEIDIPTQEYWAYLRTYDTPGPGDPIAAGYAFRSPRDELDGFAHVVDSAGGSLWGCVYDLGP